MKLDIDWYALAKALVKAIWPFIAGAVGGIVSGCTVGGIGPNFFGACGAAAPALGGSRPTPPGERGSYPCGCEAATPGDARPPLPRVRGFHSRGQEPLAPGGGGDSHPGGQ